MYLRPTLLLGPISSNFNKKPMAKSHQQIADLQIAQMFWHQLYQILFENVLRNGFSESHA
jgi:hypothetical protein